jgi:tetratricopeptide (TPR) repeat protein
MKNLIYLILFFSSIQLSSQINLTADEWKNDLKFLQNTVHDDYSFLFKKTTKEAFDEKVELLHKAIPIMQEHEIVAGFSAIVSSFEYGHTALGLRGTKYKYHQMPLVLYSYNDGIYVQASHKDYQSILGAKVVEIEGLPADEALEAIRAVVPAENDQFLKAYGINNLGIPELLHARGIMKELKNSISLKLELDGKIIHKSVAAVEGLRIPREYGYVKSDEDWLDARDLSSTPLYLKNLDKIYFFEYLADEKALYVRQSQIQDDPEESIPDFYKRVFEFVDNNDVEKLIIDVRLNGGGNNYKNKPVITGIIETEKINKPGKLFVIIGRRTFSACQNLVNELDNYTNAIFIGEPTAENINFYGDNRRIELPNSKLPVFLSFAWWQDKPQWENGPWTAPHLAVDMSFDEYKTNNDPVLEAALNFSGDNFVIDPMGYLTELFQAQKLDQLKEEAKGMVADPIYQFFNFENEFNNVGYRLMNNNQLEAAVFVLQLNTELFPNSANTWDSLAESYWKSNQIEKAVQYYNTAIELDPNGPTGDNARNMLRQIKEHK